jgi:hypothetical protein
MLALIDKATAECVAIVHSTAGYDLALYDVVETPAGDLMELRWDGAQFVPRDPTPAEEADAALEDDAWWQALKSATPAQIEAELTARVTNIATARRALKLLVLAVQRLARTR